MLAFALLLAACGGDEERSDREYFTALEIAAARAEAQDEALDAEFSFGDQPPDAEEVADFLEAFQAIFIDARADIAALAPPVDLATDHDAMVAAMDALIEEFDVARDEVETFADVLVFFNDATPLVGAYQRACLRLQQLAVDREITVELFCQQE